jgi:hypothetical protein
MNFQDPLFYEHWDDVIPFPTGVVETKEFFVEPSDDGYPMCIPSNIPEGFYIQS